MQWILPQLATHVANMYFDGTLVGFTDVGIRAVMLTPHYPHQISLRPDGTCPLQQGMQEIELTTREADRNAVNSDRTRVRVQYQAVVPKFRTVGQDKGL